MGKQQKKKFHADPDVMTLDQIEELVALAPQLFPESLREDGALGAVRAMVVVQLREVNPEASLEDAGRVLWGDIGF